MEKGLTPRERFFAKLCYDLDLSTADIARVLNITENNVYQLKNRVKEKLKNMLEKYYKTF
jgi:DNA-binding CsgD family transcriptional regulator